MKDFEQDYRQTQRGEHPGRFSGGAQTWRIGPRILTRAYDAGRGSLVPDEAVALFEATKPDARINLRLEIGWVPDEQWVSGWSHGAIDHIELDTAIPIAPPLTVDQALDASTIWLAGLSDVGGGLREAEDLVGTRAVPAKLVNDGLWGSIIEVDLDLKAVRGRLALKSGGFQGYWAVMAKWAAVSPMSDRDWSHAREKMDLTVLRSPDIAMIWDEWWPPA